MWILEVNSTNFSPIFCLENIMLWNSSWEKMEAVIFTIHVFLGSCLSSYRNTDFFKVSFCELWTLWFGAVCICTILSLIFVARFSIWYFFRFLELRREKNSHSHIMLGLIIYQKQSLKRMLRPIFCNGKNAHSDRKWKIMQNLFLKKLFLQVF